MYVDGGSLGIERTHVWFTLSKLIDEYVQIVNYRGWVSLFFARLLRCAHRTNRFTICVRKFVPICLRAALHLLFRCIVCWCFFVVPIVPVLPDLPTRQSIKTNETAQLVDGEFILPSTKWFSDDAKILQRNAIPLHVCSCFARCFSPVRPQILRHVDNHFCNYFKVVTLPPTDDIYGALLDRIETSKGILFHDRTPSPLLNLLKYRV
jgi:hypothetical protein